MKTHLKKRIEMIVEATLEGRLVGLLEVLEVKGYTIVPAQAGRGQEGSWRRGGLVGNAGHMIVVICIVDPSRADEVVNRLHDFMSNRIGIINISDVNVIRDEHF